MMHYNVSVPLMKIFPTKGLNKCTSVSIRKSGISIKLLDLLKVRMKNAFFTSCCKHLQAIGTKSGCRENTLPICKCSKSDPDPFANALSNISSIILASIENFLRTRMVI